MIRWCLVYDTVKSGVWYSDVWCIIRHRVRYSSVTHYSVSYTGAWHARVWHASTHYSSVSYISVRYIHVGHPGVWYSWLVRACSTTEEVGNLNLMTISESFIHFLAPYTKHHCIIHQTSRYHTPNITLSYTRLHRIVHQSPAPEDLTASLIVLKSTSCSRSRRTAAVSYTTHRCIIHQTSLYPTPDNMHHTPDINHTPDTQLYHTPVISIAFTTHHVVIPHRPPHTTISYTRHHSIADHFTL